MPMCKHVVCKVFEHSVLSYSRLSVPWMFMYIYIMFIGVSILIAVVVVCTNSSVFVSSHPCVPACFSLLPFPSPPHRMYTYRYDSQSSSASSTSLGGKTRKGKKPTVALDDALEMLHSEPSGWGDLPSPKPSDVDNGTEIWGVAPADVHRKNKSSSKSAREATCTCLSVVSE